ncbi:uncharacterized protein [Temnothorax nylanderi]|uniref:uncharacterized protein isoform X1 n=1 Tax=Temnothorax nylanderi TaxID=102681 RepID=UPI003A8B2A0A
MEAFVRTLVIAGQGNLRKALSILNAKIASGINALKRVLLSFGEKIEQELQQLQRQISLEQTDDVQKDVAQSLSPTLVSTVNSDTTDNETNPSSSVKVQSSEIAESSSNKTNFTSEQKSKPGKNVNLLVVLVVKSFLRKIYLIFKH